jgi:hypothetical protein
VIMKYKKGYLLNKNHMPHSVYLDPMSAADGIRLDLVFNDYKLSNSPTYNVVQVLLEDNS